MRELLHERTRLAIGLVFAFVSAIGMGAGLLGIVGVLDLINPETGSIGLSPRERWKS